MSKEKDIPLFALLCYYRIGRMHGISAGELLLGNNLRRPAVYAPLRLPYFKNHKKEFATHRQ
jgi:hypothetical protein